MGDWKFSYKNQLSDAVKFYNDNGFAGFYDLLNDEEVLDLDRAFEETLRVGTFEIGIDEMPSSMVGNDAIFMHKLYEQYAKDERILNIVENIFKSKNFELQHSKLNTKPKFDKGKGKVGWHQDFAYFPHTNPDLVAVLIRFDDEDDTTGSLRIIPKSHKEGVLSHCENKIFKYECMEVDKYSNKESVLFGGKKGLVTVHHSFTLHYSPHKTNDNSLRRMLILQYRMCDAVQLSGVIWKCTGYQVSSEHDHSYVRFFDGFKIENRGKEDGLYDLYGKLKPNR